MTFLLQFAGHMGLIQIGVGFKSGYDFIVLGLLGVASGCALGLGEYLEGRRS